MSENESIPSLDRYSRAILGELQRDARQTVQQIADAVGLSTTPCWKRIKELEASGVLVVVEANLAEHTEALVRRFEQAVAASPQIVGCLSTTGQADYILTVLVADIKAYEQCLHDTIFRLPGVTHVRSSIVLKELKAGVALPIAGAPAAASAAPRKRAARPRER